MSINCTLVLNGRPPTTLTCPGVGNFAAFSGMPSHRNNPSFTHLPNSGPLPLGRYYIVDRRSGGRLGWLYDALLASGHDTDRNRWFALYRDDGTIDDQTHIRGVQRGAFRLHPIGPEGRSEGCITLASAEHFARLSDHLRGQGPTLPAPGTSMKAYGIVEVRS